MSGPLKLSDVQGFVFTTVPQFIRTIPSKCRWIREVVQHEFRIATPVQKKAVGVALAALALILLVGTAMLIRKVCHKPDSSGLPPPGDNGSKNVDSSHGTGSHASSTATTTQQTTERGSLYDDLDLLLATIPSSTSVSHGGQDPRSAPGAGGEALTPHGTNHSQNLGCEDADLHSGGNGRGEQVIPLIPPLEATATATVGSADPALFTTIPSELNPTRSSPGFSPSHQHSLPPRTPGSLGEQASRELEKLATASFQRRPLQQTPSIYPPQSPPSYSSTGYGSPYPGYMPPTAQTPYYQQPGYYPPALVSGSYPPPQGYQQSYGYPTTPPGYPRAYPSVYPQQSGYPPSR